MTCSIARAEGARARSYCPWRLTLFQELPGSAMMGDSLWSKAAVWLLQRLDVSQIAALPSGSKQHSVVPWLESAAFAGHRSILSFSAACGSWRSFLVVATFCLPVAASFVKLQLSRWRRKGSASVAARIAGSPADDARLPSG